MSACLTPSHPKHTPPPPHHLFTPTMNTSLKHTYMFTFYGADSAFPVPYLQGFDVLVEAYSAWCWLSERIIGHPNTTRLHIVSAMLSAFSHILSHQLHFMGFPSPTPKSSLQYQSLPAADSWEAAAFFPLL